MRLGLCKIVDNCVNIRNTIWLGSHVELDCNSMIGSYNIHLNGLLNTNIYRSSDVAIIKHGRKGISELLVVGLDWVIFIEKDKDNGKEITYIHNYKYFDSNNINLDYNLLPNLNREKIRGVTCRKNCNHNRGLRECIGCDRLNKAELIYFTISDGIDTYRINFGEGCESIRNPGYISIMYVD